MNAASSTSEPTAQTPARAEPTHPPPVWSHPAQLATAFLLGVAVTLLATLLFSSLATPGPTQVQPDGQRIVPFAGTAAPSPVTMPSSIPSQESVPAPTSGKGKPLPAERSIDINQATAAELMTLPGIGPALAQRIIDQRSKSPFRSVTDLDRVPGIGPKTLEKVRPYVTAGASTASRFDH